MRIRLNGRSYFMRLLASGTMFDVTGDRLIC